MKSLWDELATHSDIAQADRQKLMQFLMGLNETYSAIRGQILLMNPLPSIRLAYSSISQEEKQRLLSSAHTNTDSNSSAAAMAVRSKPTPSATEKNEQTRSHGFPDSRDRTYSQAPELVGPQEGDRRQFGSGRGRPLCDHCGNFGH